MKTCFCRLSEPTARMRRLLNVAYVLRCAEREFMVNTIAELSFASLAFLQQHGLWFLAATLACWAGTRLASSGLSASADSLMMSQRQDDFSKRLARVECDNADLSKQVRHLYLELHECKELCIELASSGSKTKLVRNDSDMMQRQNTLDKEIDVLMSEYKKTNALMPRLQKEFDERLTRQDWQVQARMNDVDRRTTYTLENCRKLLLQMEEIQNLKDQRRGSRSSKAKTKSATEGEL